MRFVKVVGASVVCLALVATAGVAWLVCGLPAPHLVVYALPETHPNLAGRAVASAARLRISLWRRCPEQEFHPQSAVGFLVANYENGGVAERQTIERLLGQFKATGCDIDAYNASGQTPLLDAVLYGDPSLLKLLLAHGADGRATLQASTTSSSNVRSELVGATPLQYSQHLAAKRVDKPNERLTIVKLLADEAK
jgi:hypothetical protein